MYLSDDPEDVTGSVEYALACVLAADEAERKIKGSRRTLPYNTDYDAWLQQLSAEKIITSNEAGLLSKASAATQKVVMVDDFPNDVMQGARADQAQPVRKTDAAAM